MLAGNAVRMNVIIMHIGSRVAMPFGLAAVIGNVDPASVCASAIDIVFTSLGSSQIVC